MTSPSGPPQGSGGFPGQNPGQGYSAGAHAAPAPSAPAQNNGGLQNEVHTLERAIFEVKRIIVGQDQLVERMLVGLLAKGHVLLEGVPGVAKTLAVETFARSSAAPSRVSSSPPTWSRPTSSAPGSTGRAKRSSTSNSGPWW